MKRKWKLALLLIVVVTVLVAAVGAREVIIHSSGCISCSGRVVLP